MTRCESRLATQTEHGAPYWPSCDLAAGHDGGHMHGHYADVSWHWSDAEAMTPSRHTPAYPLWVAGRWIATCRCCFGKTLTSGVSK